MTQQSTQQSSKERREQWQSHIEGWQHSGKTRAAYCGQHGLSLQTFAYWRKRLNKSSGSVRLVQLPPGLLQQAVAHLGCWAHVRRKFVEAQAGRGKGSKKKGRTDEALEYIGKLYGIEQSARARNLDAAQLQALREKNSIPLLQSFRGWLDATALLTPPGGLLGKAVTYALNQWDRLTVYTGDGRLPMDNNLAENAIRPFVLGRKNWLFADTQAGAHASATMYSLIETAKANALEPYWYLRYLFEQLPLAHTEDDLKALLPQHVDTARIGQAA
jgi:transposase